MSAVNNHPITTRFHEGFGIHTKVQAQSDSAERVYLQELAEAATQTFLDPTTYSLAELKTELKQCNKFEDSLERIGSFSNRLIEKIVSNYSQKKITSVVQDYEKFRGFMQITQNGFKNTIALFLGMFLVLKELKIPLKENYSQVKQSISGFAKDLAHMQLGLFFLIQNKLGIKSFPQNCYRFNDIEKYFSFDRGKINLQDTLIEDMKKNLEEVASSNGKSGSKWVGNTEFDFGGSNPYSTKFTFDSDVPAKTCPSIYTTVAIRSGDESKEISLIDITLDWLQNLLDQTLEPELNRLEALS